MTDVSRLYLGGNRNQNMQRIAQIKVPAFRRIRLFEQSQS